jgi:phytoene dehydrogenase-like protein
MPNRAIGGFTFCVAAAAYPLTPLKAVFRHMEDNWAEARRPADVAGGFVGKRCN